MSGTGTILRGLVYLAHSTVGCGTVRAADRLRRVQAGLEQMLAGKATFVCATMPGKDEYHGGELLAAHERRVILGWGRRRGVDVVVVVHQGPDTEAVESIAKKAGIPCMYLDPAATAQMYLAGLGNERSTICCSKAGDDERWPHPSAVLRCWAVGLEDAMGLHASRLPDPNSPIGGGRRSSAAGRIEEAASRLSSAAAVVSRARRACPEWTDATDEVLVAVYRLGATYKEAAGAACLSGPPAALRHHRLAMGAVRSALST